jgi:adenylate cyclase
VDLTLADIDRFLDSEPQAKQGILAILSDDGTVLARSSSGSIVSDEKASEILEILRGRVLDRRLNRSLELEVEGVKWITHVSPIALGAGTTENLAIALPFSAITGPIARASQRTIIVSCALALLSIPLIWLISRLLSRPLTELADGTLRVRNFDLEEPFQHTSVVEEVYQLQSAMEQMRTSLRTFGRYVPKTLVRQLIARAESPEPGGRRRHVTILFMDLENFTAMSSHLEPEEVMNRMSRYFEIVTTTLQAHEATIDKYIGDSVMAMWNAPNDIEDHPRKACEAALAVIEASKAETNSWAENGQPPVRTRIGIHCGDAIIGNVGSSDRLNYTALGSAVNLASRLEGLNRDLKTSILISEDLANEVKDQFSLRKAGAFDIKGFENPVPVFELLSGPENRT